MPQNGPQKVYSIQNGGGSKCETQNLLFILGKLLNICGIKLYKQRSMNLCVTHLRRIETGNSVQCVTKNVRRHTLLLCQPNRLFD